VWAAEHKGIVAGALAGVGGLAIGGLLLATRQRS